MDDDAKFKIIFPMFRGYLVMVLYFWFLGLNVYVWNTYHINYKLAFNFDSHYSPVLSIFKQAAFSSFFFFLSFFLLLLSLVSTDLSFFCFTVSFFYF